MDVVKQGSLHRLDPQTTAWTPVWTVLDTASLCCFTDNREDSRMLFPPMLFKNCRRVFPSLSAALLVSTKTHRMDPTTALNATGSTSTSPTSSYYFAFEMGPVGDTHFFRVDGTAKKWLQWTKALASIPLLVKPHLVAKSDQRIRDDILAAFLSSIEKSAPPSPSSFRAIHKTPRVNSFLTESCARPPSLSPDVDMHRQHSNVDALVTMCKISAQDGRGVSQTMALSSPNLRAAERLDLRSNTSDASARLSTSRPRSGTTADSRARRAGSLELPASVSGHQPASLPDTHMCVQALIERENRHTQLQKEMMDLEVELGDALLRLRERGEEREALQREWDRSRVESYQLNKKIKGAHAETEEHVAHECEELRALLAEEVHSEIARVEAMWSEKRRALEVELKELNSTLGEGST